MKKTLIFIVIFLMLGGTLIANAGQIDNLQNDMDYIDGQLGEIKDKKNEQEEKAENLLDKAYDIKDDVELKKNELKKLKNDLNNIIDYINKVQISIDKAEKNLHKRETEAAARLRVMYENSNNSLFDLFLESGSISEFFQKIQIYKYIAAKDKEVMEQLYVAKKDLQAKKEMLNGDYNSLEAKIKKTQTQLNEMKLSRAELLRNVSLAQAEIRNLSSQEKRLEQESRNLAYRIKNLQVKKKYVGGKMAWPLPSDHTIHSYFGMRLHPIYGVYKMHNGVDIGGPYGASIVASNDGVVMYASYGPGYGYYVVVDHGGGISTLYGHASKLLVHSGQSVKRGQTIAYVGSTGASTGPHVHYEVRVNGDPVDPLDYFKKQ